MLTCDCDISHMVRVCHAKSGEGDTDMYSHSVIVRGQSHSGRILQNSDQTKIPDRRLATSPEITRTDRETNTC